ncbi:hypothetical protein [Flavimaricola marinus]|uniref:Uncharacterized protein n=1 Tax=Flavimaricola marinus TaxID=1819565 RepID=A0A238LGX3_9RHOB|nr:hypothetical protein [Flavimaricola marinus]SMY08793.1 hypothetical protein LOM8899_02949 [Flavimaricola marinus]
MHTTILLLGCIFGFGTALFTYFSMGFGLLVAISIWAASGPVTILLLAALYLLRGDTEFQDEQLQPEIA